MSSGGESRAHRGFRIALRILAGVVAGVCGLAFVVLALLVLSSLFGPPSRDPHGYAIIFGTIMAIPAGVLAAAFAPFAFASHQRGRVARISTWTVVAVLAAFFAILFLA